MHKPYFLINSNVYHIGVFIYLRNNLEKTQNVKWDCKVVLKMHINAKFLYKEFTKLHKNSHVACLTYVILQMESFISKWSFQFKPTTMVKVAFWKVYVYLTWNCPCARCYVSICVDDFIVFIVAQLLPKPPGFGLNRLACKLKTHLFHIHTFRVHYAHAAANLNSGNSKYAKVARVHYFCTIALRTSRAVLTRAWASCREVDL